MFSTVKQEKHEAINFCFPLKYLWLIFGPMLKLGRSSSSTRCRANVSLSNAASDIPPSICLRKRRRSTFLIEWVQANDWSSWMIPLIRNFHVEQVHFQSFHTRWLRICHRHWAVVCVSENIRSKTFLSIFHAFLGVLRIWRLFEWYETQKEISQTRILLEISRSIKPATFHQDRRYSCK
jgi:hypothetical protein